MPKRAAPIRLTDRDTDILTTLSLRIRMASIVQVARTWWLDSIDPESTARARLRLLEIAGLIKSLNANIIILPELSQPLTVWKPGQMRSDFGAVAWKLHQRWKTPAEPSTVYFATRRTAQQFAGSRRGNIPRPFQLSHDLGVAEMHFALRRIRPNLIKLWVDEDRLLPFRRGEKLPDAVLASKPSAQPILVMEFGGGYDKGRLEDFHDDCEERGLPYEIW